MKHLTLSIIAALTFATAAAEPVMPDIFWSFDSAAWLIQFFKINPLDGSAIREYSDDLSDSSRLAAAYALRERLVPDRMGLLETLQKDTDPVIRRVASESLLDAASTEKQTAEQFHYTEVLAAETKVRELIKQIQNADKKEQYARTKTVIGIGRSGIWPLYQLLQSDNNLVKNTAAYAIQEINCRIKNLGPKWAQEIETKLKKEISFNYTDKPLSEAIEDVLLC